MRAGCTAAIVGTGFIAGVHLEALRRLEIDIAGVVGSSPERAREALGGRRPPRIYASLEEMLEDPSVDVVHLATPNAYHYAQAKACLAARKHVICEKPLATTTAQSMELLDLAAASGLVHCVNFNLRFHAQVREARRLVRAGAIGDVWGVRGSYLQDWLLEETDWNWRLDPGKGGELRVVADIGSHWLDLAQFVAGHHVTGVCGDLATVLPVRMRPKQGSRTFTSSQGEAVAVDIMTEDTANVLLRFDGGARGTVALSQVSAGRRNELDLQIDGPEGSIAWSSQQSEVLWIGRRGEANQVLLREPATSDMRGGSLPAGHTEGFHDSFKLLYKAVYSAIETGAESDFPTFRDGHAVQLVADAILRSGREGGWIGVQE